MQAAVVTFDHLALAALGCYGNAQFRTPNFDRFAADAVVFDQCFCGQRTDSIPALTKLAAQLREQGDFASLVDVDCEGPPAPTIQQAVEAWHAAGAAGTSALIGLQCSA